MNSIEPTYRKGDVITANQFAGHLNCNPRRDQVVTGTSKTRVCKTVYARAAVRMRGRTTNCRVTKYITRTGTFNFVPAGLNGASLPKPLLRTTLTYNFKGPIRLFKHGRTGHVHHVYSVHDHTRLIIAYTLFLYPYSPLFIDSTTTYTLLQVRQDTIHPPTT